MVQAAFANLVQTMVCWPWSSFGGGVRPQRRQRCSFTDRESFVTNELCTAGDGHERVVCTDIAKTTADAACGSASSSRAVIGAQSATLLGSESELIPTPVSMAELVVQLENLQQDQSTLRHDFDYFLSQGREPRVSRGRRLSEVLAELQPESTSVTAAEEGAISGSLPIPANEIAASTVSLDLESLRDEVERIWDAIATTLEAKLAQATREYSGNVINQLCKSTEVLNEQVVGISKTLDLHVQDMQKIIEDIRRDHQDATQDIRADMQEKICKLWASIGTVQQDNLRSVDELMESCTSRIARLEQLMLNLPVHVHDVLHACATAPGDAGKTDAAAAQALPNIGPGPVNSTTGMPDSSSLTQVQRLVYSSAAPTPVNPIVAPLAWMAVPVVHPRMPVQQQQQLQQGASVADADFLGQQTRHAHLSAPADPKLMGERLGETAADLGRMLSRQSQCPRRVLEATPAATDSPSPVLVSGPTDHTPRGKPASVVPSVVKGRGYTSPSMPMVHSIHHMGYSATRLPMRASLGPPCALGTASSLLPMHAAHAQASLPQRSPSTPPGQPAGTFYQI